MNTHRHCPMCKTKAALPMHGPRNIDKKTRELTISVITQSSNEEGEPLEMLCPLPGSPDDGHELHVEYEWDEEKSNQVHFKITRVLRSDASPKQIKNLGDSSADLHTRAAMVNLEVVPTWTKAVLAKKVAEAEKAAEAEKEKAAT